MVNNKKNIGHLFLSFLIILIFGACGQMTLKDEGMDSKSIETTATETTTSLPTLTISSNSPINGKGNVDRYGLSIVITFNQDVYWMNSDNSSTTSFSTSETTPDSCGTDKLVLLSSTNFVDCHPSNYTMSNNQFIMNVNGTLDSDTTYKVKVLQKSTDNNITTQTYSGVVLYEDYIFSFKTED